MTGRPGRFLGDPLPDPRKRTTLEQAIAAEQADIAAEQAKQEYAEAQGLIMQALGKDEKEPKTP